MNNKLFVRSLCILILFVGIISCEKVIDLDLGSNSSSIVIEGKVSNQLEPYQVKITRSVNFDQDNNFPSVTNALVIISDSDGNEDTLIEISPGVYNSSALTGVPGTIYYLYVKVGDEIYSAQSIMPASVPLEDIEIGENSSFGGDQKTITPVYTDPIGKGNYYNLVVYKNNERVKSYFLRDDNNSDGLHIQQALFSSDIDIESGDSVKVALQAIDEPTHLYLYSLTQNGSGPNASASPANPVSNISGGCLGYFSAYAVSIKKVKVQ